MSSESMKLNVSVVGLGFMGSALAHSLITEGFAVTVWNRTRAKAEPLQKMGAQLAASVEEAARGLGKTPWQAFISVTLPLLWRGVGAGAALVFLLAMKELPATLILSPIGFKTLATAIWSASEEAFFARAAAPALLLVLIASVPLALMEIRRVRPERETLS